MRIALIGYGKMGKIIHQLSEMKGHQIVSQITSKNSQDIGQLSRNNVDVAIEFTNPKSALSNYETLLENNIPVVTGTTGWHEAYDKLAEIVARNNGTFFHASNFSIGVNLYFEVNKHLARLINGYEAFDVSIEEIHHTEKKDAPSGTAITIANQIIQNIERKDNWTLSPSSDKSQIDIHAKREANVFGTHEVKYLSDIDEITIKHVARNRKGFAQGAILAAEWIHDKKGIFTMEDLLKVNIG